MDKKIDSKKILDETDSLISKIESVLDGHDLMIVNCALSTLAVGAAVTIAEEFNDEKLKSLDVLTNLIKEAKLQVLSKSSEAQH